MPKDSILQRDEALARLRALKPQFLDMNIRRLALFGSTARDEAGPDSDVDLLVEFAGRPAGFLELFKRRDQIRDYLGCPVDLYPLNGVQAERHPDIVEDMIDV